MTTQELATSCIVECVVGVWRLALTVFSTKSSKMPGRYFFARGRRQNQQAKGVGGSSL